MDIIKTKREIYKYTYNPLLAISSYDVTTETASCMR